ncbi:ERP1 protein [Histoplasma capsulatum var. duboisii H88]|uniref:ERP1 protein n=2 Tax=Ajellomyces capsulatus TaxID=5037 RepID=F0U5L2_AJEC8|nr:ERP1 protein [Histoplasma capsulatum H143]EGC42149.1 ERP1 protein [Histoplasma capsulatum var. duboisii H88]KAG5297491.1 ERP1 protein [Histoplasma ohiense (nom. inval.)]QSS51427.1 ERP1 protein [Histoplasma capsulatum var. duboisii H88]
MASSRSQSWLPSFFAIVTILTLSTPAHSLYFYVQPRQQKCFFEDMPQGTLVVGNYKAEVFKNEVNAYTTDPGLTLTITVDETFDNDHRVVFQRGSDTGRFTFSAADAGQHKLCFTPDPGATQGWLSASPAIKLTLDMVIGETSKIESEDKSKMEDMAHRVKNLNSRLQDIRREQVFQREREALFRNQSEATNARVVRWTLIQLGLLSLTCAWQLSHLRSFFIKQKLT